jgi:hypothetical protein
MGMAVSEFRGGAMTGLTAASGRLWSVSLAWFLPNNGGAYFRRAKGELDGLGFLDLLGSI